MAAELEQFRKDVEELSKKFRDVGQNDLADLLRADAQGFGVKADIAKTRGLENLVPSVSTGEASSPKDIGALLGYTPEQIAYQPDQISRETKAYVGSLVYYDNEGRIIPIFTKLSSVERIYTAFPEGEIVISELTIGSMKLAQLWKALERGGFRVSDYAEDMMRSRDFTTLSKPETIRIARLPVRAMCPDIEFPTTVQMYQRADDLGLDKCPAEVGPHQRLKDTDQPMNTWYYIAMKQIAGRDGDPSVFGLGRHGGGIVLDGAWANPDDGWGPGGGVAFAFRKST